MREYCCEKLKKGWFVRIWENETIDLQEKNNNHYFEDIKYCPWCGKDIKND